GCGGVGDREADLAGADRRGVVAERGEDRRHRGVGPLVGDDVDALAGADREPLLDRHLRALAELDDVRAGGELDGADDRLRAGTAVDDLAVDGDVVRLTEDALDHVRLAARGRAGWAPREHERPRRTGPRQ